MPCKWQGQYQFPNYLCTASGEWYSRVCESNWDCYEEAGVKEDEKP